MDGTHPKRKKDKYNPYVLSIENNRYYISFKDGQGQPQKVEISESLYEAFDEFELEDISHLNQVSRYQEQSELTEVSLHSRAVEVPEPLEEQVYRKLLREKLHKAIGKLPEVQRRRLILYYFSGYTYQQIAEMEGCKHPAIMKSVAAAEKKLKKYF